MRPQAPEVADRLARELGLPPMVARVLAARGLVEVEAVGRFIDPGLSQLNNPDLLLDMDRAADRIHHAIKAGEKIVIYGDYDVDGVTATSIMILTLRALGARPEYHIPHRMNDGYGLNCEAVDQLAADGARLIVSVDCGISSIEAAARARALGVDLIITDHHEPPPELPEAYAVVNPKRPGCGYPNKALSGAGVAFKLAHAVLRAAHPDAEAAKELLKGLLDLATLGTVADMVPIEEENRAMVAHGLRLLNPSERIGLMALIREAGIKEGRTLDAQTISFMLAPRLNAAGRTEHANFAVELLLTEDPAEAAALARKLEEFNRSRRQIEQAMLTDARRRLEPYAEDRVIVVEGESWHPGVLGIVASRIQNRHYRPTFVIGLNGEVGKGSGRSVVGFDLYEALAACGEHLIQFGGHPMAAGLTIQPERIEAFREAINAHADSVMDAQTLSPLHTIDTEGRAEELTEDTVRAFDSLAPHGAGNPRPCVSLEGFTLIEAPRIYKERILKLTLAGPDGRTLSALGWSMAHRVEELPLGGGPLRVIGMPMLNHFQGRTTVEFEMTDFQAPEA